MSSYAQEQVVLLSLVLLLVVVYAPLLQLARSARDLPTTTHTIQYHYSEGIAVTERY